jgi:uncharacterized protein (TIGR03435 family)
MVRLIGGIGSIVATVTGLLGQSTPQALAFDVASVRIHNGPLTRIFDFSTSGSRMTLVAYPAIGVIMEAYNLKRYQVSFATSDLRQDDTYYDIFANASGDGIPTRGEFQQMLQTLLADRFNLKIHRATKEMAVYALVVGKNGPRFKESAADANQIVNHGVNGPNQTTTGSQYTMAMLAGDMNGYFGVDRPVVDKTGLSGAYNLKIEATPEFRMNRTSAFGDISIFTAIQNQLGLKLEPQKGVIEILVVDHFEKPSAN